MPLGPDEVPFSRGPFHEQNGQSKDARPLIQKSWHRCWPRLHLEQDASLEPEELPEMVETSSRLLSAAEPALVEICRYVQDQDIALVLVNQSGYVISIQGGSSILDYLCERNVVLGADLSEYGAGTNAFGLALIEYIPVEVQGDEHFLRKFQGLVDAAAPVFDPSSRLLGAVGIFGYLEDQLVSNLALAIMVASSITGHYKFHELTEEKLVQIARLDQILAKLTDGVVTWNDEGRVSYANLAAERILGVRKKKLLGGSLHETIQIPAEIWEEFQANQGVHEVETSLRVDRRQVACLLTLSSLSDGEGTLAFFRQPGDIQKLVTREVSTRGNFGQEDIIGVSPQIQRIRRQVQTAAQARASVLISGEPGTGKSLLAQIIYSQSDCREGPFIVFQCASLPCGLIVPELLGSARDPDKERKCRISKFELADGGVLYFQDIDLLPLEAQDILLKYLRTGTVQNAGSSSKSEVQTRIVAATSSPLEKLTAEGKFNDELLSWLRVFPIDIPPLRERKEDIPILAGHIIERFSCLRRSDLELAPEALALMLDYDWPGNIRELELILERAVYCLGGGSRITSAQLPLSILKKAPIVEEEALEDRTQPLDQLQRVALIQAARDCHGNISEMARALGIGRTTVWRWLKRMNISLDHYR